MVNRFRQVLDGCIDEDQGAIAPGRQITDNIFIAYEILHSFKKKRDGCQGSFALQLDMSKAYDRAEWVFLEKMMGRLGLSNDWVSLMINCVSTVSYSVIFNRV